MLPELSQSEILRYARHLTMTDIGIQGQRKLKAGSVLIVGTGGLGSPISLYLAAAGIGRIGLVDFDTVDSSNLQRQIVHSEAEIGNPKVYSAKKRLESINPHIQIETWNERFSVENAESISNSYEIILDGTDNLYTRYLINDLCVLKEKIYIYGSVHQLEGQMSVFDAKKGPCYRCIFKQPPPPELMPDGVQAGIIGALPGIIGSLEAVEAIKILTGMESSMIGKLFLFDAVSMDFQKISMKKNPQCPVCGEHPDILSISDQNPHYSKPSIPIPAENDWISCSQLKQKLDQGEKLLLLDIRSNTEQQISQINETINIPINLLRGRLDELDADKQIIIITHNPETRGVLAFHLLKEMNFTNTKILTGGINEWVSAYQPDSPIY